MSDDTSMLKARFGWLADAPLFIDTAQIMRFYDAVVRPDSATGTTTISVTEEKLKEIQGKFGVSLDVEPGKLATLLSPLFAFLKPKAAVSGEGAVNASRRGEQSVQLELHPIENPERQLVSLALHYLTANPDRLFLVTDPSSLEWRDMKSISKVPRSLIFLDLPGQAEAMDSKMISTKIVPTAAEFDNGVIELLFDKLKSSEGCPPPKYPDNRPSTPEELATTRKKYWSWFDQNYDSTMAMRAIEDAAARNGRIRWIDYRLPLTADGQTLHLHIRPGGHYDTGALAYNFVRRGAKHGVRLVGTLKSEPDMNVLAIYEK